MQLARLSKPHFSSSSSSSANAIVGNSSKNKNNIDINFLNTGRIIYYLIDGTEPKEYLDYRDFVTDKRYITKLIQTAYGEGRHIESSFYLDVTIIDKNNQSKTLKIGLPDYKRKGVKQYRIKQVLVSPDNASLIYVIEKEELDTTGNNIRYMIETARIK